MSAIFCGVGGNIIKKLSDVLFNGFNKLFEMGMEIDDIRKEQDEDGSDTLYVQIKTGGDHTLRVKMTRLKDNRWDMLVQGEDNKKKEIQNITPDKADDVLTDLIDQWYGESYEGLDDTEDLFKNEHKDVKESSIIRFRFSPIRGSEDVALTSVQCSIQTAKQAAEAFDALMSDTDFIESIPENDVVYDIIPQDDSFEIEENLGQNIECSCNCFAILMAVCNNTLCDMNTIRWNLHVRYTDQIRCLIGDREWTLRSMMDQLAGLSVEFYNQAPDAKSLQYDTSLIDTSCPICEDEAIQIIKNDIQEIIDNLEMYRCNVSPDVQLLFDTWTRDLKQYLNQTLRNM